MKLVVVITTQRDDPKNRGYLIKISLLVNWMQYRVCSVFKEIYFGLSAASQISTTFQAFVTSLPSSGLFTQSCSPCGDRATI